jgi:hypothetical protein
MCITVADFSERSSLSCSSCSWCADHGYSEPYLGAPDIAGGTQ